MYVTDIKNLCAEQSYYARSREFTQYLNNIKLLFDEDTSPFIKCHIFYAWPTSDNQESEYWVQPFLYRLRSDLRKAGINALIDFVDLSMCDNTRWFIETSYSSDYIILFGTDSLSDKINSDIAYMEKYELSCALEKYEKDIHRYGNSNILSILMTEQLYMHFSSIFGNYYCDIKSGYIKMFHYLLDEIYHDKMNKKLLEYVDLLLSFKNIFIRLSREVIEKELKLNYHHDLLHHLMKDYNYGVTYTKRIMHHFNEIKPIKINTQPTEIKPKPTKIKFKQNNTSSYVNDNNQYQYPSISKKFSKHKELIKNIMGGFESSKTGYVTILCIYILSASCLFFCICIVTFCANTFIFR